MSVGLHTSTMARCWTSSASQPMLRKWAYSSSSSSWELPIMCLAIGITWHFRALRTFFVTCLSSISNPKHLPLARSRPGSVKHLETNPCFLMTLVSCEGLELAVLDVWSLGSVRRLTDKRSQDPSLGSSEIITLSLLDAMLSQARPRDADAHSIPSPV